MLQHITFMTIGQTPRHDVVPEIVTRLGPGVEVDELGALDGRALAGCDLVVMHCMGYTETQRAAIARGSGRPVLLARRLVAAAISQLL